MSSIITFLIVLVCVLLILSVLVQNSKGGGLASGFSASNQVMGVQKTTELIEKITWGLVTALFVLCILLSFVVKSGSTTGQRDTELREKLNGASSSSSAPIKNVPAGAAKTAKPMENYTPAPAKK